MVEAMTGFDTFSNPEMVENLRRSIVMLGVGQVANLDRERALQLVAELQRLQADHKVVVGQLRELLQRLEHPSASR